jgi:hypothetical protein
MGLADRAFDGSYFHDAHVFKGKISPLRPKRIGFKLYTHCRFLSSLAQGKEFTVPDSFGTFHIRLFMNKSLRSRYWNFGDWRLARWVIRCMGLLVDELAVGSTGIRRHTAPLVYYR